METLPVDRAKRRKVVNKLRWAGWTLKEIGDRYGVTREWIRQITTVPASQVPRRYKWWCGDCGIEVITDRRFCVDCREARTHLSGYAYGRGCRCVECIMTNRRRAANARLRLREYVAGGVSQHPLVRHGTQYAYSTYSCRCGPCGVANNEASRNRR